MIERITDQTSFDEAGISHLIANGTEVVVQYSRDVYDPTLLRKIDALALRHGEDLQIRFYGHLRTPFDFGLLQYLPSVQNLAVDCLNKIKNIEALHQLERLIRFRIGVDDALPPDLLDSPALTHVNDLVLADSRTPRLRLHPIPRMPNLRRLHLTGYSNGIETLGDAKTIEDLSLSKMGNRVRLDFLNRMTGLRSLLIILGGRQDFSEVEHDHLQTLEIIRVRGLSELDPGAFPDLRSLQIEDQIRLEEIDFTESNSKLEELKIVNCKGLHTLKGLANLKQLSKLLISRTQIDVDSLLSLGLPNKLKQFGFYGLRESADRAIRDKLDALGYSIR